MKKESIEQYVEIIKTLQNLEKVYGSAQTLVCRENKNLLQKLESHILELKSQNAWNPYETIESLAQHSNESIFDFCEKNSLFNYPLKYFKTMDKKRKEERVKDIDWLYGNIPTIVGIWGQNIEKFNHKKFVKQAALVLDIFKRHDFDINQSFKLEQANEERNFVLQINRTWSSIHVFNWLTSEGANYGQILLKNIDEQKSAAVHDTLHKRVMEIGFMSMKMQDYEQLLKALKCPPQEYVQKYLDTVAPKAQNEKIKKQIKI